MLKSTVLIDRLKADKLIKQQTLASCFIHINYIITLNRKPARLA